MVISMLQRGQVTQENQNANVKPSNTQSNFVPGNLVVLFRDGTPKEEVDKVINKYPELTMNEYLDLLETAVLTCPLGKEDELSDALSLEPLVESAEKNYSGEILP